jgi:transposase
MVLSTTTNCRQVPRRPGPEAEIMPFTTPWTTVWFGALHLWLQQTLATLSRKSATAKAIAYALTRWEALQRYCDDGRIEIDNNAAEHALRCVALGHKNFVFAGSDSGGQSAAAFYSLLGSAKLNGHNLEAFLREVLARIGDHPINRIADLLPWNLKPTHDQALTAVDNAPQLPTPI